MKEAKKKLKAFDIIMIVILVIVIIAFMIPLRSCVPRYTGDFEYKIDKDNLYITNISLTSKKNKYIIVPSQIKGKPIFCLGTHNYFADGFIFEEFEGYWKSKKLEKLYINCINAPYVAKGLVGKESCPNLHKIIINYPHNVYRNLTSREIYFYFSKDVIIEYEDQKYNSYYNKYPANVTFYLNYEVKEGEREYHWIDDVEDGEKIEVVPEEPKREGYKFGGWYKEQECINKWDFAKDTVEKVKVDRTNYKEFVENKLYAKWMKD